MSHTALVLGGSVFVGKHLVERLLAQGDHVAVLNRGRTPSTLPSDVERLVADRTDAEQMRAALDGRDWDAVYDVSGFVMAAGGSDIDGLLDLLDGRVGAYVYTSSIMAYDQSLVGVFPWTEDQPTNPDGPATYGGFKALAERAILARHARTGFPGSVARPAAIYGPDNNIYDMELPMFLRLQQRRPILVPHEGLVVGSYGHVDDLCEAMIKMAGSAAAAGAVFNVSGESVDVNRYVAVLAAVVGVEPDVVHVPNEMLPDLVAGARPAFGHLFKIRHHAILSTAKLQQLLAVTPRFDLVSGHTHTFEWFRAQGYEQLSEPLVDPVWKATWDFEHEAAIAGRIRCRDDERPPLDPAHLEPQSLPDAEIHRAVAATVLDVLLPALRDDADWARAAALQLVGLTRYAAARGPDRTAARVAELADVLTTLAGNELVARAWDGNLSQRAVMEAAGVVLAEAAGRDDPAANEARAAIRSVLVRQLDDELADTAPLVDAFRGKLDG